MRQPRTTSSPRRRLPSRTRSATAPRIKDANLSHPYTGKPASEKYRRGLHGKRIVIAGGATGIGAATAERLAAEGAEVVVGDITLDCVQATAKRITDEGRTAVAVEFDFADESRVHALISQAVAELGGIDRLYNAGADVSMDTMSSDTDLLDMDPAGLAAQDVNLLGYALTCREVIPHPLGRRGGVIVNTSSGAAWGGDLPRPAYATAKAGVSARTPAHRGLLGQGGDPLQRIRTRRGDDRRPQAERLIADSTRPSACAGLSSPTAAGHSP